MVTSTQFTSCILLGAILLTACVEDSVDPSENPFANAGSAGSAGSAASVGVGGGGGTPGDASTSGGAGGMPPGDSSTTGPCNLSGRWLAVQRSVEEAIGVQTALRNWMYFEFAQSGQNVTTTRGLDCGFDVVPLSAVSGSADLHKAWPKITENNHMTDRTATIQATASGCTVSFPSYVTVYGATVPHYRNKSHALPSPTDKASGSTPGWEDWDADGNPGVTYNLSGIANGQVFYSSRQTNTWSGTVSQTTSSITLAVVPIHENDLLGYNGSSLLATPSNVAADRKLHFVELVRLDASQATGDDQATCNAVRALAPTLAPNANAKPF
jgi:hypothetical protein